MKFIGFIANVIKKPGSCATTQKMTQRQFYRLRKDFNHTSGMSQRQSARKFNISQQRVCKYCRTMVFVLERK